MPFRLTNAPTTLQTLINNILREYLNIFVVAYLDDILIYSKSIREHNVHVRKVLKALKAHNLKARPKKCKFYKTKVEFLGFIITIEGIKIDPKKV